MRRPNRDRGRNHLRLVELAPHRLGDLTPEPVHGDVAGVPLSLFRTGPFLVTDVALCGVPELVRERRTDIAHRNDLCVWPPFAFVVGAVRSDRWPCTFNADQTIVGVVRGQARVVAFARMPADADCDNGYS